VKNEENIIDITGGMNRMNVKVAVLVIIMFLAVCSFAQAADEWDTRNIYITDNDNGLLAIDKIKKNPNLGNRGLWVSAYQLADKPEAWIGIMVKMTGTVTHAERLNDGIFVLQVLVKDGKNPEMYIIISYFFLDRAKKIKMPKEGTDITLVGYMTGIAPWPPELDTYVVPDCMFALVGNKFVVNK
jgi:hypothetical protein